MTTVAITGEVFRWARERAGFSNERLAQSIKIKPDKLRAWESGHDYPSFHQAQKLATALSVPLGYLFLSHPPEITIPIADFRTLPDIEKGSLSLNLQDVLDDALRKRDWYAEWRKHEGFAAYEFVGKYTAQSKPAQIVQDMHQVLEISPNFTANMSSWEEHLRKFVQKVEAAGILVLQSGIVGNNTHKKLSVQDFRGFALADEFAPIVFINAQDAISARIFTLAHELAHLWTGTSGISNPDIAQSEKEIVQEERLCNHIAAEFLVSHQEFSHFWDRNQDTVENANRLARYFRVSAQVILRRSYDFGLIPADEYYQAFQEVKKASKIHKTGGGGNFYNTLFSRNSHRFTRELISAVHSGNLSYLEAARLLNTHPKQLVNAMNIIG